MGNDVPVINDKNQKDCCNQDSGISLLSIVESAGKSVAGAVHKAENFGAGVVAGAAAGLGIGISKETAETIGKGAVMVGVGGAAALAAEQAFKHPGAAAVIGAGAVGATVGAELLKGTVKDAGKGAGAAAACAAECAKDVVKDAAVGALVGGAIGACSGDATRAVTLAAMGAVTGVAARCAAEMCKPCCCVKPETALDAMKDVGKAVLDHIKNRPVEAGAEAVLGGPAGVVGGAMIRKMLEQKDCEKLCDKVMKHTCCEIQKQAEIAATVMAPGAVIGAKVGIEAGKAAAESIKQADKELEQHRKDNPTTSKIEQGIGYVAGGPIAGKLVGTAIEVGDIKTRQAYNWVKSWFE